MYCDLSAFAEVAVTSLSLSAPYSDAYKVRSLIFAVTLRSVDRYGEAAYRSLCIRRVAQLRISGESSNQNDTIDKSSLLSFAYLSLM